MVICSGPEPLLPLPRLRTISGPAVDEEPDADWTRVPLPLDAAAVELALVAVVERLMIISGPGPPEAASGLSQSTARISITAATVKTVPESSESSLGGAQVARLQGLANGGEVLLALADLKSISSSKWSALAQGGNSGEGGFSPRQVAGLEGLPELLKILLASLKVLLLLVNRGRYRLLLT